MLSFDNETVKISVAIKDVKNENAIVSHNIIMTTPHFLRFAEVCQKSAKNLIDKSKLKKE